VTNSLPSSNTPRWTGHHSQQGRVLYCARVETHDVEQHTPHAKVDYEPGLAKHAAQTIAGPLERAAVTRDTERHLGLDHLGGALVQRGSGEIWGTLAGWQNTNEL
jgi:hypothetical protein